MAWREVFVYVEEGSDVIARDLRRGRDWRRGALRAQWMESTANSGFPWGTLLINVTGSLLLTFMYGLLEGTAAAPEWRAFLGIGVLGGYTTFSTFSYESVRLLQDGEWERALLYAAGSVILSIGGAVLGFRLASALLQRG
jgi:CrcB protein